jgi:two-component system, sensor histidine kinase and response regulator
MVVFSADPHRAETMLAIRGELCRSTADPAILTELGYALDFADDGVEALELVARRAYLAVLMDCQMPNMDGYEATGELRRRELLAERPSRTEDSARPRMPIIAMTAAALKEDRDRCLAAGMDDYLTKPIQPDELAAALIRWTTGAASAPHGGIPTPAVVSTETSILHRLDALREHASAGLVARLITSFLTRAPGYLSELADFLDLGGVDAFTQAAHSLNGAAGNIGASTMGTICEELEALGRDDQRRSAPDLLHRLRLEYAIVRRILEDEATQPATSTQ